MKFAIAFAAILAVSSAQFSGFGPSRATPRPTVRPSVPVASRVSSSDQAAKILRYDNDINPDGSYTYVLETDNGINLQVQGTPRDFGGNPPLIPVVAQGSYSYTSPDGQPIGISWIADENGYQATGDAIPTSPPVPEAIARALVYLAKLPQKK